MFYHHEWDEKEIQDCYLQAYGDCEIDSGNSIERFGGLLLPFIGGLIVGWLFIPKTGGFNNAHQSYQVQPPMQYQYPAYYPPYQTSVNNYPYYPGTN